MRTPRLVSHILYLLAELAFAALVIGCVSAAHDGAGLLASCGAFAAGSLLTFSFVLHVLLVRANHSVESKPVTDDTFARTSTSYPITPETPVTTEEHRAQPALPQPPLLPEVSPQAITMTVEPAALAKDAAEPDDNLSLRLMRAEDPIAELRDMAGAIRARVDRPQSPDDVPCGLERYALRMLEEAGLFETDQELPSLGISMATSDMIRLSVFADEVSPAAQLRILRLESALNAIKLALDRLPRDASIEDAYQLNQRFARSITAQADGPAALPAQGDSLPDGEWAVRYGIAQAIATLRLPHRLEVRYRTNVADGNVALEVGLTPADVFPASAQVDGLGIVPTTGDMRQQAAADYMLRLALLLAACAFRCSERVRHVWVAGIVEGAERRTCYLSVDFDRYRFERVDLGALDDLAETYRSFAPCMRYEQGWLRPVKQTFHLEEERFCPVRRYVPPSLSSRRLAEPLATRLGTDHVSGLAIEEADGRSVVASAIMRKLVPDADAQATSRNVRIIMQLAGDDPDPTVRLAAERVIGGLVDGSLSSDPQVLGEEFVRGDILTRTVDRAKELLAHQKPNEAHEVLAPLIAALDQEGTYADTSTISYRYFSSYVERTMYNRLYGAAEPDQSVLLVPDAYYEAHLILSVTELMAGHPDRAFRHAERMVELAPLDARARLHLVKCLEELDRDDEAVEQLCQLLEEAHEPTGVAIAYYRMAAFQWMRDNVAAAQACYQRAMQVLPEAIPMITMEYTILSLQHPELVHEETTSAQIDEVLSGNGIPLAPTDRTSQVFYECAQASIDAEVFPVARNFAYVLDAFDGGGDDIISDVIHSLEDAPDR